MTKNKRKKKETDNRELRTDRREHASAVIHNGIVSLCYVTRNGMAIRTYDLVCGLCIIIHSIYTISEPAGALPH
jgi:hypothetical protein